MLIGRMVAVAIDLAALTMLLLVVVGTVPLLVTLMLGAFNPPVPSSLSAHPTLFLGGLASAIAAASTALIVSVFRMAIKCVNSFFHVRQLRWYVESVPDDVRDLEIETIVFAAYKERTYPGMGVLKSEFEKPLVPEQSDSGSAQAPP
jgi:hypothetical protein